MKKRIITVLLVAVLLLLCACGQSKQAENVNLLENGSFEDVSGGLPNGWILERYNQNDPIDNYGTVNRDDSPDGINAVRLQNDTPNDARFMQEVTVEPNTYYKLSANVKTGSIYGETDTGANISCMQTYCVSEFVTADTDWTHVTVYGKTDRKTKSVTVAVRLGYYSAECGGCAYFDNVSLEKISKLPEGVEALSMAKFEFSAPERDKKSSDIADIEISVLLRAGFYFSVLALFAYFAFNNREKFSFKLACIIIAISVLVRLAASVMYVGFKVDINCFSVWGRHMANVGPLHFYSEDYFCDYPPLYMLVVGLLSAIFSGISLSNGIGLMILKLPAVLCDALAALLILKEAKKHTDEHTASVLAIVYAVLPTAILNSAIWGQVDSVLVLFMLLTFALIDNDKFGMSVITYFVGLLFKPQAILFAPVMALSAFREFQEIFTDKQTAKKRLCRGFGGLAISLALFALLTLLMRNGQRLTWLIEKYTETFGSYDYATLNSFGFMGLIGGQWADTAITSVFGISYSLLGTLLLAFVVIASLLLFVFASKRSGGKAERKYFWLISVLLLSGIVTFATRTHERYIFPVIALLTVCAFRFEDLRYMWLALGYGFVNFVNTAAVLYIYEDLGVYMSKNDAVFIGGSLAATVLFVLTAILSFSIVLRKKGKSFADTVSRDGNNDEKASGKSKNTVKLERLRARRSFSLPKVTWKDIVICVLITAIYAGIAFTKLGDTVAPETQWHTKLSPVYVTADLGEETQIDDILFSAVSAHGSFTLSYSSDGESYSEYGTYSPTAVSSWQSCGGNAFSARYVRLTSRSAITLNELAFMKNGERILPENVKTSVTPMDSSCADGKYLFDYTGDVSADGNSGVPITEWTSGGRFILHFPSPISIYEIQSYITYAEPEASVDISIMSDGEWILAAQLMSYGSMPDWCGMSYCVTADELNGISEIMLDGGDGAIHLGEIAILNENGLVEGITYDALDGADIMQIASCFDEQEKFTSASELAERFTDSEVWRVTSCSDYVIADFGETKHIDRGTYYASVCAGKFSVYYSYDGINWSEKEEHTENAGDLYYWRGLPSNEGRYDDLNARYVAICGETQNLRFIEFAFFESADSVSPIPIVNITASSDSENGGRNIFDEQELVPTRASYMNSMYFDEIYHARTAYESVNGLSIYEWTHPPLGKDMISWCVSLMGMNPFAWRFAGTLAGVLMLPAMYFIGLLMFRKTSWATCLTALMALDGMHFVQTRIATIDSFSVMFIIYMFLFMYWYYSISFYDKKLSRTFIPLGLCGLCFGLGAASKWICLYAGAGLAVLFFITMYRRFDEYRTAKSMLDSSSGEEKEYLTHICDSFVPNLCKTILFCILVFVIIPVIIYCASYYPYFHAEGETRAWYKIILDNQTAMFNYHSKLDATHPFQSDWYSWPVIYRPMFFYSGKNLPKGRMECISSFGNPAVWYAGLACTLIGIVIFVMRFLGTKLPADTRKSGFASLFAPGDETLKDRDERDTRLLVFLLIGVACNLLPWVGVSRCIFIYHYFATVPFIIMFTVYVVRYLCRKYRKSGIAVLAVLLIAALVLFIMFKPVWSGTEVSKEYVNTYLRWFDSWVFGS